MIVKGFKEASSFESILTHIQIPKPGSYTKIFLKDFEAAVKAYCGEYFSGMQIKTLFARFAEQKSLKGGQDVDEKTYMDISTFKQEFYPRQKWKPKFETDSERDRNAMNRFVDQERDSVSSASLHIENMLAGKDKADLMAEKDLEERKQIVI